MKIFSIIFGAAILVSGATTATTQQTTEYGAMCSLKTNEDAVYGRGCCSHHGGQSYCSFDGHWICADGWESGCKCK